MIRIVGSNIPVHRTTPWLVRSFATSLIVYGKVKAKIGIFQRTHDVRPLSLREEREKLERQKLKIREQRMKPYSDQKFRHLVQQRGVSELQTNEDISGDAIALLQLSDLRMMYNYLGTSGFQLKDSYVVERDVLKMLKKGHHMKALLLCKLAKDNGVVGMNHILEYYLNSKNYSMAFKLINWRKKWHVPCNEHTYTILFNGFAKLREPLSKNQVEKLYTSYHDLVSQYRSKRKQEADGKNVIGVSVIHINSVLSALINTVPENQRYAWKVFESLTYSGPHSADNLTYTIMLSSLRHVQDQQQYVMLFDKLLDSVSERSLSSVRVGQTAKILKIDLKLLISFANAATRIQPQDDPRKLVAYRLFEHFVNLEKYNLEEIAGKIFDLESIYNGSNVNRLLEEPNKNKYLPNRPVLTALVKLINSVSEAAGHEALGKITVTNPKALDFVFIKEWLNLKEKTVKVTQVGTVLKTELVSLLKTAEDNFEDKEKAKVFIKSLLQSENNYILARLYKAYGTQVFHLNEQVFNEKRFDGKTGHSKQLFIEKKRRANLKFYYEISSLSKENVLSFENQETDLHIFHSYLGALFNLQLPIEKNHEIFFRCTNFLRTSNSFTDLFQSDARPSDRELMLVKSVLLNTVKYTQYLIDDLTMNEDDFHKLDLEKEEPEDVRQRRLLLRYKKNLLEPVNMIDRLLKKKQF